MPQFLILADDHTDPDALSRRLSVRKQHLQRMRNEKADGRFVIGGAKLNKDNTMIGSMLVVQLDKEEEVWLWVKEDPYFKNKVWEHIEIIPFRVAEV